MTYRACYEEGQKILEEAGIGEAALDARILLEYVCHTNRNHLLVYGDREVAAEEISFYKKLIAGRKTRIPLQYLTGRQEFMGLSFTVNEAVLIPRQDTEILVEKVCKAVKPGMHILDMCTGSGCILISILHHTKGCTGVGADISQDALTVAKENAARLLSGQKADFIESDLFARVEGKFDMIVSNPPYIRSGVIAALMPEVKDYEPMNALDGMEDGLFFYRQIVRHGKEYLKPEGILFFEIGYDQAEAVGQILSENGYEHIETVKDYAGLDRVVCARCSK